jgi:uncharacterized Zn ribbon protein
MQAIQLFEAVPVSHESAALTGRGEFLAEYGVVIAPSAMEHAESIRGWFRQHGLSTSQMNGTAFYRSWQKVASTPDQQRLVDQVVHYISTYGLQMMGLDSPDLIYLPTDEFAEPAPERIGLQVIRGVPRRELIQAGLEMLARGAAMKQETIAAVITCLVDECGYSFTGQETIRNREALVMIADRTGVLPQRGDDLLRYLVYKATGESLVIKNEMLIAKIKASGFALPALTDDQMIALAASFLRMKPIWMAFKQAHVSNRPIVNRLAKLAKHHHEAIRPSVLGTLTTREWSSSEVRSAAECAPTGQIVRALNAVRFYQNADNQARYYRIRNGKSFAATDTRDRAGIPLAQYEGVLLQVLRERVGEQPVRLPERVELAFPASEKQFVGAIPTGSRVAIPMNGETILIGVYWENGEASHVDLDLSGIAENGSKIGWNADWNTSQMRYSGDVTDAPHGASEWLYTKGVTQPYLVTLNAYNAPEDHPFKVVIGYGDKKIRQNYMIDPNQVIFSADATISQKQMVLGILVPTPDGLSFVLTGAALGNKIVSRENEHETVARQALVAQATATLRLQDVFPEAADGVDLTGTLAVDTLLALAHPHG